MHKLCIIECLERQTAQFHWIASLFFPEADTMWVVVVLQIEKSTHVYRLADGRVVHACCSLQLGTMK